MIIEKEELKHFEKIRKKEQKKRRREQKERLKKMREVFCWLIVLIIISAFFAYQLYMHREMTEANTHEITVKVDNVIVDWESEYVLPNELYPDVKIMSGDITYYAYPPIREKESSLEEIAYEDQVILTVTNSNPIKFVGVRSESKVYYDMERHHNEYYKTLRLFDVIVLCITIFLYLLVFLLWHSPEIYWRIGRHLKKKSKKIGAKTQANNLLQVLC